MNSCDKVLLELLSRALFNYETTFNTNEIDYFGLYENCFSQAVIPLIYNNFTSEEFEAMGEKIEKYYEQSTIQFLAFRERLLFEQEAVINILNKNNIDYVLLKGVSLAENYKDKEYRTLGDIDILVEPSKIQDAVNILVENGYSKPKNITHPCHLSLSKNGIDIEIHRIPNGVQNSGKAKKMLTEFFSTAVSSKIVVNNVNVMSIKHQFVCIVLHNLSHFLNGQLGLRQLCDYATFIDKQLNKEIFEELESFLKKCGIYNFANITANCCVKAFHLDSSKISYFGECDENLVNKVLDKILLDGNFGRKKEISGEDFFSSYNSKTRIGSIIKKVFCSAKIHFPIIKKLPFLIIFAPIMELVRFIYLVLTKKRKKFKIRKAFKQSKNSQKLYKSLNPYKEQK